MRALRSGLRFVAVQIGKEMGELESTWGDVTRKMVVTFPSYCNMKWYQDRTRLVVNINFLFLLQYTVAKVFSQTLTII